MFGRLFAPLGIKIRPSIQQLNPPPQIISDVQQQTLADITACFTERLHGNFLASIRCEIAPFGLRRRLRHVMKTGCQLQQE
ncbi:hypothetical protein WK78_23745 [Burkholderia cepacia]|nr:hypothetical protein WK78_23745 [Burkholderia cepacia]